MTDKAELRLALVCYGGVSLAVYMHGITKELHKLICAARQVDDPTVTEYPVPGGTEEVYFTALRGITNGGLRLSVGIDIIGGTSAGGINGIALSKALARNVGMEPLKKVWIDGGDIRQLLRGPTWLPLTPQVFVTVARQLVSLFGNTSPLKGEYMSKLLFTALTDMENGTSLSPRPTLLPDDNDELELYVPTTDLDGFEVLVPSGAGGASNRDKDFRQVLVFSGKGKGLPQFGADYTPDLAFAGRATSCFPGAFAPVSQKSFRTEIKKQLNLDITLHPKTVFLCQYDPAHTDEVYFVDGGVLDNAPFDVVIDAIARRSAQTRVFRQLVYVEPDPGQELYSEIRAKATTKRRWLRDLVAVSSVRGNHPILADLTKLRDLNWRIAGVRAIAEQQEKYVEAQTKTALQKVSPMRAGATPLGVPEATTTELVADIQTVDEGRGNTDASDALIQEASDRLYAQAEESLGPAWPTYQRLKFEAVLKRLADEINRHFGYPRPSSKAGFVAAAWIAWGRQLDAWQYGQTDGLQPLLRDSDMPYRERRLRFILQGINDLYDAPAGQETPPVADLDALKQTAWSMMTDISTGTPDAVGRIGAAGGLELLRVTDDTAVRIDPTDFALDNCEKFQILFDAYSTALEPFRSESKKLLTEFQDHTRGWPPKHQEAKDSLLNRYLGFGLWDGILFPTISLSELPQLSPIPVSQFSPGNAKALVPPIEDGATLTRPGPDVKAPAKLKGIPVKHFAAFFAAKSRENDYLWGRLDGAELILRLLADLAKKHVPAAAAADGSVPWLAEALGAVLNTEADLRRVKKLREYLALQVDELPRTSSRR